MTHDQVSMHGRCVVCRLANEKIGRNTNSKAKLMQNMITLYQIVFVWVWVFLFATGHKAVVHCNFVTPILCRFLSHLWWPGRQLDTSTAIGFFASSLARLLIIRCGDWQFLLSRRCVAGGFAGVICMDQGCQKLKVHEYRVGLLTNLLWPLLNVGCGIIPSFDGCCYIVAWTWLWPHVFCSYYICRQ